MVSKQLLETLEKRPVALVVVFCFGLELTASMTVAAEAPAHRASD